MSGMAWHVTFPRYNLFDTGYWCRRQLFGAMEIPNVCSFLYRFTLRFPLSDSLASTQHLYPASTGDLLVRVLFLFLCDVLPWSIRDRVRGVSCGWKVYDA